jgi:hypothetical protein
MSRSPASSNDSATAPRQTASSHDSWPTVTPRLDLRAELRHGARRALPSHAGDITGSAFQLKTGSDF